MLINHLILDAIIIDWVIFGDATQQNNFELFLISIIISALAAFSAAFALILNTIHQRKSVNPSLPFHFQTTYENGIDRIGCFLINKGLGPAEIRDIVLLNQNGDIYKTSNLKTIKSFKKHLPKCVVFSLPEPGDYIKVNDNYALLTLSIADIEKEIRESKNIITGSTATAKSKNGVIGDFMELFYNYTVTVKFKSIYGKRKEISRNLSDLKESDDNKND